MTHFSLETRGAIALATFARPPRNLMNMAAMSELEELLASLADDDAITVVVITGGVPGYFVAHADVEDLARLGRGEPIEGDPGSWGRAFALLESMPQPVVAAVNGQAWGGGCELALACTMRVAAEAAHFAQPEVAVGIIPGAGGTQRLPRVVGPGKAAEMILSGRVVDAHEAERIGLVQAVLPDVEFVDRVIDWVSPIAAMPRAAIVAAKRAMVDGARLSLDEGLALESRLFLECQTSPDTLAIQDGVVERYRTADPDEHLDL
jgi:enoyl-CoA hydratase/carnithine racemase